MRAVAKALYTPGPTEEEAQAYGLTVEEASGPPVEVWPDNLEAVNVFIAMSTQWRIGMAGPTGLDYTALAHTMRLCGVKAADRASVFAEVRTLEDAALETLRAAKK